MNTEQSKLLACGAAFAITLITGLILGNSEKPYGTLIFTVHKLVALGTAILIGVSIYNMQKTAVIDAFSPVVFGMTWLFLLALVVTGGVLSVVDGTSVSLDESLLQVVLRIHQIVPLLAVIASSFSLYLLVSRQS